VGKYPEFLPWCAEARVQEVSATERVATLKISRGVLKAEFTTRNLLTPDSEIHMQLLHGPFREFSGLWRFAAIGAGGARVQFGSSSSSRTG
jgi:ribosome-associated toxin RatA of RatAB toxin-antitoxin module